MIAPSMASAITQHEESLMWLARPSISHLTNTIGHVGSGLSSRKSLLLLKLKNLSTPIYFLAPSSLTSLCMSDQLTPAPRSRIVLSLINLASIALRRRFSARISFHLAGLLLGLSIGFEIADVAILLIFRSGFLVAKSGRRVAKSGLWAAWI